MKFFFYFIVIFIFFFSFVMMTLGMISDETPLYVQLIICFIGAPSWVCGLYITGKLYDFYFKD